MANADKAIRDLLGEEWAETYTRVCEIDEPQVWVSLWQIVKDFNQNLKQYQQAKLQQEAD